MRIFASIVGTMVLTLTPAIAQEPSQVSADSESKADLVGGRNQYVALGDPIQMVAPKYPKHALKEHVQGNVVLRISVSAKGKVHDVAPISGDPELAEAASHAVRQWEFVPYFEDERPIEAQAKITIIFKINDSGHPEISATYDAPRPPPEGQVFKVGDGVAAPKAFYAPDPQYTEPARHDKIQGVVELSVIILPNGTTGSVHVTKSLRPDLDAEAVAAVGHWRFRPATKDGTPVAVQIHVEVNFHLY